MQVEQLENRELHIILDLAEVEEGTGMTSGYPVATVDVNLDDGTYSRFFVEMRINKRNQAVIEVVTRKDHRANVTRKNLTAQCRMHGTQGD